LIFSIIEEKNVRNPDAPENPATLRYFADLPNLKR
jgi:hypothetical protein